MSVLPKGWVETTLGDFIEFKYGKSLPTQKRTGEGVPVYGSSGIVGHHSEALVSRRGLIIGRKGSYGVVNKSDQSFFPIDTTYYVDEFYGQPIEYWFYYLRYLPLTEMNRSTAIPGLNRDDAYSLVVKVPPLNEQIRIANKLDSLLAKVDAAQARLEKIPTLLKRFRQSVLAAATSGELTREWRGERNIKSWKQAILKDVANIIDPQPSHRTPAEESDGIPYIGIGDLRNDGSIDFDRARKVSVDVLIEHKNRYQLSLGDFIFGKIGTLGKATALPVGREYTLSANVILIQPNRQLVESSYLMYFLSSPETMHEISGQATSTSQAAFGIKKMREFKCKVPEKDEQVEIVRRVEYLFSKADLVEKQYGEAKLNIDRLTQSILAKAFRGELMPQDPNDEPASELLNRIRSERAQIGSSYKSSKKSVKQKKSKISSGKSKMSKSRKDDDVWHKPYLANIIDKMGLAIGATELYGKADLSVGEFYKQLAWEEKQNFIVAEGDVLRLTK